MSGNSWYLISASLYNSKNRRRAVLPGPSQVLPLLCKTAKSGKMNCRIHKERKSYWKNNFSPHLHLSELFLLCSTWAAFLRIKYMFGSFWTSFPELSVAWQQWKRVPWFHSPFRHHPHEPTNQIHLVPEPFCSSPLQLFLPKMPQQFYFLLGPSLLQIWTLNLQFKGHL